MPTPFKKKRIIRKIYREQKRMLDEELEFAANRELTPEELEHLQQHADEIKAQLAKLVPRQPLDWIAAMVRVGIAIIIFILLLLPPYTFVRNQYLAPQVATSTSATGGAVVTNYIAATPAPIAPRLWNQTGADGPIELASSTNIGGMTAGIIPSNVSTTKGIVPGVAIFFTETQNNKRILRKMVTDDFFRWPFTVSSTVWDDHDFIGASAVSSGTRSLVAASYRDASGGAVSLQTYDMTGQVVNNRVDLRLDLPNESADDVQITPWAKGWALTTRVPRGGESSLFDPTRIIIRFLDDKLRVSTTTQLELSGYEIGPFPQLVPNRRGATGYTLVASAHPLIRSQRDPIGDDIYAFMFNDSRELTSMLRLTNNGREHDYNTTGFAFGPSDTYILGVQNIPLASTDDPNNGYPFTSGRAYFRFFDQIFDIAGTIIVYDDPAVKTQADNLGVANLHQVYIGNRLFMAYDMLNGDSSVANAPVRSIMAGWINIAQR